jgi:3-dehydroquinate dehydratase II
MKILVINGANLQKLGERDSSHYGRLTLKDIENLLIKEFPEEDFQFFQSDIEGEIVARLNKISSENIDGLIINPGGYAHTSVAIRDSLELLQIPKIEVHLSNLSARELFRQNLITASGCNGYISGLKENSYIAAAYIIRNMSRSKEN